MTGYSTGIFPTTAGQGGGGGGPTFVSDVQDMIGGAAFATMYGVSGGIGDEVVYIPVFRAGALNRIRTNVTVNTLPGTATILLAVDGVPHLGNMISYLPGELGAKFITFIDPLAVKSRIALVISGVGGGSISVSSSLEYQPS